MIIKIHNCWSNLSDILAKTATLMHSLPILNVALSRVNLSFSFSKQSQKAVSTQSTGNMTGRMSGLFKPASDVFSKQSTILLGYFGPVNIICYNHKNSFSGWRGNKPKHCFKPVHRLVANKQPCLLQSSVAVLAEILLRSPWKLFIFMIKVSKNKII